MEALKIMGQLWIVAILLSIAAIIYIQLPMKTTFYICRKLFLLTGIASCFVLIEHQQKIGPEQATLFMLVWLNPILMLFIGLLDEICKIGWKGSKQNEPLDHPPSESWFP